MKWQRLRPAPDVFDFAPFDTIVAWAERNGLAVRGHNLLWHQPKWQPKWLNAYDFGSHPRAGYERELRQEAAGADFPIRFLGDVPDEELSQIYDRADIFAMTSINHGDSIEGFGLVYLEAAAHGLPVVAHRVDGGPVTLGFLLGAMGGGALLGAWLLTTLSHRGLPRHVSIPLATVGFGAALVVVTGGP